MTRRACVSAVAAAFSIYAPGYAPGVARAGGLFVPGYGSQAQPRAGAFVAKADDPSALYYNPAGLAKQRGTTVHLGFNFVDFDQTFQRAGVYEAPDDGAPPPWTGDPYPEVSDASRPALGFGGFQGIPLLAVVTDLGGITPFVFAAGIMAEHGFPEREYGGGYQFEDPNTPPPPQRYDIVAQDVSAAFPSIAAGYRLSPFFDVGLRVSWGFAGAKAKQHLWGLRNYAEDVHTDGVFEADVSDGFIPSAGAGLLVRPHPDLELGLAYNSPRSLAMKGEGVAVLGSGLGEGGVNDFIAPENDRPLCASGGTLTALKSCLNVKLPQTAGVGVRYIVRDQAGGERGDIEVDMQWEDWSSASDIEVIVDGKSGILGTRLQPAIARHGFRDTFSFRAGGSYSLPIGAQRLEGRAGVAYDTAAAPRSWTRLDIDGMARTTLGAGLALEVGQLRFDLGGGMVLEQDRTVDECNTSLDQLGCNSPDAETPQEEREAPDPIQPLSDADTQVESPFNGGTYSQSYVLVSLGVTYRF